MTEEQYMNLILKKFPNFHGAWQEYMDDWLEPGETSLNHMMTALSHYAEDLMIKGGAEQELKNMFVLIEKLLQDGNPDYVHVAAATFFLENLINVASWGTISPFSFVHLLGEESKAYCKAWDEFSGDKTEGLWDDEK